MPFRSHWRDCQAWRDDGFHWSTTSNEAVKFYDAALSQVVGYYEDESLGGLENTLKKMKEADPNFVMGQVMAASMGFAGGSTPNAYLCTESRKEIEKIKALAEGQKLSSLEDQHLQALYKLADGKTEEACCIYDNILLKQPEDLAAVNISLFAYLFTGEQAAMRECLAKVVPRCRPSIPMYSYLYGLWGFACTESNVYDQGEKLARKALELNQHDTWASHSLAHVLDHTCRQKESAKFLTDTMDDWEKSINLATHNNWHLALCHLENGDQDAALGIYDDKIGRIKNSAFSFVDRASLLRRLEIQGVNVGSRWNDVYEGIRPYIDNHNNVFGEYHFLLACLGSKHITDAKNFINNVPEIIKTLPSHNYYGRNTEAVGIPLYKALLAYEEEDFATTVNLLRPIKNKLASIGGSNAQRDLVELTLIDAALKSSDPLHSQLPRALLYERQAKRGVTPMTESLMARALMKHENII